MSEAHRVTAPQIRLVVLDWAGTTVDHGSFAPVASFIAAFAQHGIDVTPAEARVPMGLHKRDHIRATLQDAQVASRWQKVHGRAWTESDVDKVFADFIPLQLDVIERHSRLIPGLLDCVARLRSASIKIGTTTGYFREAAEQTYAAAREQGYVPDACLCPDDDVPAGRPEPWMIHRLMETFRVFPPAAVLKVGDTVPDIEEGRNAGVWSVGVTRTGSEVGCTEDELHRLPPDQVRQLCTAATAKLTSVGAHFVIDSVADVPALVTEINGRMTRGERP